MVNKDVYNLLGRVVHYAAYVHRRVLTTESNRAATGAPQAEVGREKIEHMASGINIYSKWPLYCIISRNLVNMRSNT